MKEITPLEFAQGFKVEMVPCSKRVARRDRRKRIKTLRFIGKHGLEAFFDHVFNKEFKKSFEGE